MKARRAMNPVAFCSAVVALSVASAPIEAQVASQRLPKFVDYPVGVFRGSRAPLRLDRADMDFRTRYRELYASPPNFAGHYALSIVGCGTGCVFLLTIDLKTGHTARFDVPSGEGLGHCPEDYRNAAGETIFHEFYFRPNSRLFVVTGQMPGNDCGVRYFVEMNGRMTQIRDVHLEKTP